MKSIKGRCEFGVLFFIYLLKLLFTRCFMFLTKCFYDVFTMLPGKPMGAVRVFYDRELSLLTWRTMLVCHFSLMWWSQLSTNPHIIISIGHFSGLSQLLFFCVRFLLVKPGPHCAIKTIAKVITDVT